MSSKAARLRKKKAAQSAKKVLATVGREIPHPPPQGAETGRGAAIRPTKERKSRGTWAEPQGGVKSQQPIVDLAHDRIGQLHVDRKITTSQEQAARSWQWLRAKYLAEMPEISGYKSCLAGSVPGYDDGDGDAVVIAAYRAMERSLSLPQRRMMLLVCDMNERPPNIEILRAALDVIAGA